MSTEEVSGNSDTRTLATLQAFARAISHAVRTPLAVISNDLHYLASRDDSALAGTTALQCRRIAAILDLAGSLGTGRGTFVDTSLDDLEPILGARAIPSTIEGDTSLVVSIDHARFLLMLRLTKALIDSDELVTTVALRAESPKLRCVVRNTCIDRRSGSETASDSPLALWPDRIEAPLLQALVESHDGVFDSVSSLEIVFLLPERNR